MLPSLRVLFISGHDYDATIVLGRQLIAMISPGAILRCRQRYGIMIHARLLARACLMVTIRDGARIIAIFRSSPSYADDDAMLAYVRGVIEVII